MLHNKQEAGTSATKEVCITAKSCETLTLAQVFAPLARLLGLYSIKEELEALSFMYSDPEAYAAVQRRLDALAKQQGDVVLSVSLECFTPGNRDAVVLRSLAVTPVDAGCMMHCSPLLCLRS